MKNIYVSATFVDLEKYRERMNLIIRRMNHVDISMENYVAEDKRPLDKCLEDVAKCDIYVGIFAWRYGHIPPGYDKSITELEYRKAIECDRPRLIFLVKDDASWQANLIEKEKIQTINNLRKELENDRVIAYFSSIDELEARLTEAIHKWEKDNSGELPKKNTYNDDKSKEINTDSELQKSRKIESIENSLEKLYYPLQDILKKSIVRFESIRKEITNIGNNNRMRDADISRDENKDVLNAWQTIIRNYYYLRKGFDKIIRFTYLSHSKNLEVGFQEIIEDPGGNEILRLIEILAENWNNLGIAKIEKIRKSIDVNSFLVKMIDNCDNRRIELWRIVSEDIEQLKHKRNKLMG